MVEAETQGQGPWVRSVCLAVSCLSARPNMETDCFSPSRWATVMDGLSAQSQRSREERWLLEDSTPECMPRCVTPLSAPRREAAVALLLVALLWRTGALHVVGFRGPCRTLARDDPSLVLMSLLVCQIVCKSGQRDSIPWLSTQKHGGRTEEVWALGRGDPHGSTLPSRVISCRSAREGCFPPCNRQATMGTGTSKRRTPRRENRGVWIEHEKKSHQVCLR